ncbi:Aspyridones efflux protein apdF [Colletotrichum siamense]|nr:Aspyridones efflux protein apdF [Colletotrichum siamense]
MAVNEMELDKPAPDGGFKAWTMALLGHLVTFNTWGYFLCYGVFQTYYVSSLSRSLSDIAWIGSLQMFLLFFVGTFSGRALDAGFFRHTVAVGAALNILGIFITSICEQYWQVLLAQGVCTGIGSGLQFAPAMSLVSTYFSTNRNLAIGIVATGSATGGMVYPVIFQQLLPRVGFGWAVRTLGFLNLSLSALVVAFMESRLPPRKSGSLLDFDALKDPTYLLCCAAMVLNFLAVVIGRMLPNYLADKKFGALNTIIPVTFTTGVMMFAWTGVVTHKSLIVFAVLYGISSASLQSMFPAMISSLCPDPRKAGTRMGMAFTIVSFACLMGPPIAGALIRALDGEFLGAQLWGGSLLILGGLILVVSRLLKTGLKFRVKV